MNWETSKLLKETEDGTKLDWIMLVCKMAGHRAVPGTPFLFFTFGDSTNVVKNGWSQVEAKHHPNPRMCQNILAMSPGRQAWKGSCQEESRTGQRQQKSRAGGMQRNSHLWRGEAAKMQPQKTTGIRVGLTSVDLPAEAEG